MTSMLRVADFQPLDDRRLRLTFSDGLVRDVDCSFLMHGNAGQPLNGPDYFHQVRVDEEARTVVWPNGLDPSPELLHGERDHPTTVARARTAQR